MKKITFLFQPKSNSYISLCILLLFYFSSVTLYAAEDSTVPIENTAQMTEEATIEPSLPNIPENTTIPETPTLAPPTLESPLPELSTQDAILPDIPNESVNPPASSEENFTVEDFTGTYYISSSGGLNVRRGPSTQYDIIGNLPYGEEINVTGKTNNDWYELPYQGTIGFISAKYVSTEPVSPILFETEEIPETPETIIEENTTEQEFTPFFSETPLILLFIAIVAILIIIMITIYSFFRNNHSYDYDESEYDDDEYSDSSFDDDND